jgi:hypothetical protein
MEINEIGLIAVVIYTCWRYHCILSSVYRFDDKLRIGVDVLYTGTMIWLLALGHMLFIGVHVAVSICGVFRGAYLFIRAGPLPFFYESSGKGLRNYWHHLAIDASIGIVTWLTMIGGGAVF